jgi:hypothetical protein
MTELRGHGSRARARTGTMVSPTFLGLLVLLGILVLLDPLVKMVRLVLTARRALRDLKGSKDPREIREILVRKGYRVIPE